jgi:hypothetical protein
MKPYQILDEASADLDSAATWYEEQREGLGLELVAEFRDRLAWALSMFETGAPQGIRRAEAKFDAFVSADLNATPSCWQ